jgi:ATP-dependent Lhr-like helicase
MNLAGIVIPGDRISAVPGKQVVYRNGTLYSESEPNSTPSEKLPVALPPMLPSASTPPAPRLF